VHDQTADETYRNRVLDELQEKTDGLIYKLLAKAEQPYTGNESNRYCEALFCAGYEAAGFVETLKLRGAPIITQGQQTFQWDDGNDSPITQLFRRMTVFDRSISVQILSRTTPFETRSLKEVRERFLSGSNETNEPWNIHLPSPLPLPPLILPNFLASNDCQLLPQARDAYWREKSTAKVQQWEEWKDISEWILLSEGGVNTAPQMAKQALATWMTVQEGSVGFCWLSTQGQYGSNWYDWLAAPSDYTGGRWLYIVLKPGQSIFFKSGTVYFLFRARGCQTLALGGHVLQWSDASRWIIVLNALREKALLSTNRQEKERITTELPRVVGMLINDRVDNRDKCGGEAVFEELGGRPAVANFLHHFQVRKLTSVTEDEG